MFHAVDGLYFERAPDGGVVITKMNTPKADSGIAMQFKVDAGTWASAVASVSVLGESRETFDLAAQFHDMTELPVDDGDEDHTEKGTEKGRSLSG